MPDIIRIAPSEVMQYISVSEVDEGIELIGKLYEECYGKKLERANDNVENKDIIQTFFWM